MTQSRFSNSSPLQKKKKKEDSSRPGTPLFFFSRHTTNPWPILSMTKNPTRKTSAAMDGYWTDIMKVLNVTPTITLTKVIALIIFVCTTIVLVINQ
jgi:hypothetical protein